MEYKLLLNEILIKLILVRRDISMLINVDVGNFSLICNFKLKFGKML